MPDKLPDHETLEKTLKTEPARVLNALPDCVESREAKRLVDIVVDLAYIARDRHRAGR